MKTWALVLYLISSAATAGDFDPAVIHIEGRLSSAGKPVPVAHFYVAPERTETVAKVEPSGKFVVELVSPRGYSVDIHAEGCGPLRRTLELDAKGTADLGEVVLFPLRTAHLSVVVGPRGSITAKQSQQIEVTSGSCANVRAQDDSGCRVTFCANQDGADLALNRYSPSGQLRSLGKLSIADALGKSPRGGTYVAGPDQNLVLEKGATLALDASDPYCMAIIHVDDVL